MAVTVLSSIFQVSNPSGNSPCCVPKGSVKVSLILMRSYACCQSLLGEWDMPVGLGQSGPIIGTGSGVNPAQIHVWRIEAGLFPKAYLEYGG